MITNDTKERIAYLAQQAGAAFDEAFIDDMIVHHEGALAMAALVSQKTDRPELLKLAEDVIKAQTSEIQMLRQWKEAWFKN